VKIQHGKSREAPGGVKENDDGREISEG